MWHISLTLLTLRVCIISSSWRQMQKQKASDKTKSIVPFSIGSFRCWFWADMQKHETSTLQWIIHGDFRFLGKLPPLRNIIKTTHACLSTIINSTVFPHIRCTFPAVTVIYAPLRQSLTYSFRILGFLFEYPFPTPSLHNSYFEHFSSLRLCAFKIILTVIIHLWLYHRV